MPAQPTFMIDYFRKLYSLAINDSTTKYAIYKKKKNLACLKKVGALFETLSWQAHTYLVTSAMKQDYQLKAQCLSISMGL